MKRKLLSLFLIFFTILLSGCTTNPSESSSDADTTDTLSVGSQITRTEVSLIYMPFEEFCACTTDVVEATFCNLTTADGQYVYEFAVTKNIRGLGTPTSIFIKSIPADYIVIGENIQFSTYECPYKKGESYLLLLERHRDVYSDGDWFGFVSSSLIIQTSNRSSSHTTPTFQLYGQSLFDHIQSESLIKSFQNNEYTQAILELTKNNEFYRGASYIESTDMETVIQNSDFVFEITVKSFFMDGNGRITYDCTLDKKLKGDTEFEIIGVTFPKGTVEIGKSYIVAVTELVDSGKRNFLMSSKNSIFDCSERETIQDIIKSGNT